MKTTTHLLRLTPCHRATRKLVIALPCIVDGSQVSSFSYMMSCTCVCHLIWLTYRFKVINSLMRDAWVSSYKQTDWSWPPIFRTVRLQPRDHSFRFSLSVFLQLQSWLCVGMFCKRTIFCVSYIRILGQKFVGTFLAHEVFHLPLLEASRVVKAPSGEGGNV